MCIVVFVELFEGDDSFVHKTYFSGILGYFSILFLKFQYPFRLIFLFFFYVIFSLEYK